MSISIIIPTYNRASILRRVLEGYSAQSGDHQMIELLVVDDGSTDETPAVVEECGSSSTVPVRYLRQKNAGVTVARNYAIREARSDLILLGDDDIIPSRRMVAEHVAYHKKHPEPEVGVLGFVDWDPQVNPTPFMIWSGLHGPQFEFGCMKPGQEVGFGHTYFCNTSVKARYLVENGQFDESFNQYGWEDVELGYRLRKKGFRMLYSPEAVGYHFKRETFSDALRRREGLYRSWPQFGRTEAGHYFLTQWRNRQIESHGGIKGTIKNVLRPFKSSLMSLCRPLADTRIPLPSWLYNMLFYHYITPFSEFVANTDRA
jgi:glycosyltransferase involved in cell wall biosynthesis